jgi:hypothetical protein
MDNSPEPTKTFEFKEEELFSLYYNIQPQNGGVPNVEITKAMNITNPLEECALALIKDELQVHVYQEDLLVKAVLGKIDRFMIYSPGGRDVHERLNIKIIGEI